MKIKKSVTVFVSHEEAESIVANEISRRQSDEGNYYNDTVICRTDKGFTIQCSQNEYEDKV